MGTLAVPGRQGHSQRVESRWAMNIEPVVIPHVRLDAEIPAAKPPAPDHLLPPPTAEQAQVADRVFAHDQEASAVAGLLGMWSATLLLHDLMAEHLARP